MLITDLYEGGDAAELVSRIRRLVGVGVNVIVLLALSDAGRPSYSLQLAAEIADRGVAVFGCTPDQFPDLMACALRRGNVHN